MIHPFRNPSRLLSGTLLGLYLLLLNSWSAAGTVRIVFDYAYDSNGFFTTERRVLLERAAAEFTSRMTTTTWARVDPATAGGHYELAVVNPSTLAVSWTADPIIPANQITIRVGAIDFTKAPFAMMNDSAGDGAVQLMSIRNVSGAMTGLLTNPALFRPVDASIAFDLQGIQGFGATITRQWYFPANADLNLDDRNGVDPHHDGYTDFYDAAVHEIGHVLGIHNPDVFQTFLASDPNFCAAWKSRVQSDGLGGCVFTGAHASQFYYGHTGANIPLDLNTLCHWADGVRSVTSGGWTSLNYEDGRPYFRVAFSELEFGALQDLGYVITPVPPPSITSLAVNGSSANLQMDGLIPYLQWYLATNTDVTAPTGWANAQIMVPAGTTTSMSQSLPVNLNRLFFQLRR